MATAGEEKTNEDDESTYRALVIDSGPIIKLNAINALKSKAKHFYTVPAVLAEIRDAKAREHLSRLPFDLIAKEPRPESINAIIEFARQTGDYQSLSSVDIQVLALLYELECEGCQGDISHIRKTPKRTVGVGKIEYMGEEKKTTKINSEESKEEHPPTETSVITKTTTTESSDNASNVVSQENQNKPKSWAMITNPSAASSTLPSVEGGSTATTGDTAKPSSIAEEALHVPFGQMNVTPNNNQEEEGEHKEEDNKDHGQFSDAEDDDEIQILVDPEENNNQDDDDDSNDEEKYCDPENMSDEECDVYILDPDEVQEKNRIAEEEDDESSQDGGEKAENSNDEQQVQLEKSIEEELQSEFPSLAASLHVPYEGEDDEDENDNETSKDPKTPISTNEEGASNSSGKGYNSFRKYGHLFNNATPKKVSKSESSAVESSSVTNLQNTAVAEEQQQGGEQHDPSKSRIIGGTGMSGQGADVEDDGEGWITTGQDIRAMKASGMLDPLRNNHHNKKKNQGPAVVKKDLGPPMGLRTACTTTDFAMQNVILQMNLELLSVDGMKVRKLKSWVTRCGACYKVYSDMETTATGGPNMKRLFCEHCGSDLLQRIAASVDGKTGRLRLHMKKNYKTNIRGTKYSLPKPGTHNRFQGDLLLREDQLLTGAWNQQVKIKSGGKAKKAAQSMFGQDLAANVGCYTHSATADDIKVGFGRRNPNAAKGRERRGKKKKSKDKACGLRRYNN